MLGRVTCLLVCSAVVAGCGSTVKSSDDAPATNAEPTVSTESEPCLPRGTGLVSIVALPDRKPLSRTSVTAVQLRVGFAFAVTIANNGCAPEREVTVNVVAEAEPEFAGKGRIERIDPGERATANIGQLPLPSIEKRLLLRVEVEPVPTEVQLDNNTAEYPVKFVLG